MIDTILVFFREAPLWQLIVAFIAVYVALLMVGVRLRRREVTDRRDTLEPEEPRRHVDNRSVNSENQMGGQTAWQITNEGPQPRRISPAAGDVLIEELQKYPPEQFIVTPMTDPESSELGDTLRSLLQQGGWQLLSGDLAMGMMSVTPSGVTVETKSESDSVKVLIGWLRNVGLNPNVDRGEPGMAMRIRRDMGMGVPSVHVVVGVLPQS